MSARPGDGQERGVPHPAHRQMDRDQSAGAAKQCSKIEPGPASIQVLLHTAEACCMEGREDCSINRPVRHGAAGRRRANLVRTTREKAGFSCPALPCPALPCCSDLRGSPSWAVPPHLPWTASDDGAAGSSSSSRGMPDTQTDPTLFTQWRCLRQPRPCGIAWRRCWHPNGTDGRTDGREGRSG